MRPLRYHAGQIAIQDEANTRVLADNLAHWVGPVAEFAAGADLLLFASHAANDHLHFTVLSGGAPMAEAICSSAIAFQLPGDVPILPEGRVGGLAINMERARRVRINGEIRYQAGVPILELEEAFTLCRKYVAAMVALDPTPIAGPASCVSTPADDDGLVAHLASATTMFLASAAPDGAPDVAHRGGPAGFISYDPVKGSITWPEFLGDGVFKSAGNVRATGRCTLLVPDFTTGGAFELLCTAAKYVNHRTSRRERLAPLVQDGRPYPMQGEMTAEVVHVTWLPGLMQPRAAVATRDLVTSRSEVYEQAPA